MIRIAQMRRWTTLMVLAFCWLGMSGIVVAIEVEEVIWGFDGKVIPYRFNPVSVLLSNPSEEPVSATLRLTAAQLQGGDRIGARIEEDVFLSPYAMRWVQFYPFMANMGHEWSITWGPLPSQRYELTAPVVGGRARIALLDRDQVSQQKSGVAALPDVLFPPFVSATDNLEVLFLDYVPRWQLPQRQALLDWVQSGGTLVLSPGANGSYPDFTSELSLFNSPLNEQPVGQGTVWRAESRAAAITLATERRSPRDDVPGLEGMGGAWNVMNDLIGPIQHLTRPDHNWTMIHAMSLIYLAMIFPGWYLLSRRPTHYRTTLLSFMGIVVLFSIVFHMIGKRGYGEATTVHAVGIARQIEPGSYDVMQWANVFVTGGDQYSLDYDGEGDLYSTGDVYERVNGVIDNGLDGQFLVDVPLFSSRAYLHRNKAKGPQFQATIESASAKTGENGVGELTALVLDIQPAPERIDGLLVWYRHRMHFLQFKDGKYRLTYSTYAEAWWNGKPNNWTDGYGYGFRYGGNNGMDVASTLSSLTFPLVAYDLGLRGTDEGAHLANVSSPMTASFEPPDDQIRLYLYGAMPDEFSVRHAALGQQQGHVLYSIDLRLPEGCIEHVPGWQPDDQRQAVEEDIEYESMEDDEETEGENGVTDRLDTEVQIDHAIDEETEGDDHKEGADADSDQQDEIQEPEVTTK